MAIGMYLLFAGILVYIGRVLFVPAKRSDAVPSFLRGTRAVVLFIICVLLSFFIELHVNNDILRDHGIVPENVSTVEISYHSFGSDEWNGVKRTIDAEDIAEICRAVDSARKIRTPISGFALGGYPYDIDMRFQMKDGSITTVGIQGGGSEVLFFNYGKDTLFGAEAYALYHTDFFSWWQSLPMELHPFSE